MALQHLQLLVRAVRLVGLLPFRIANNPMHAQPSRQAVIVCIAYTAALSAMTSASLAFYLWDHHTHMFVQATFMFSLVLAKISSCIRTWSMCCVQLRQRRALIDLFNNALRIHVMFVHSYGTMHNDTLAFFDHHCKRLVNWKMASLVLQSMVIVMSAVVFVQESHAAWPTTLMYSLQSNMIDILMLVYTSMYFAVTLVALQFFRTINERLTQTVAVLRELMQCRSSDEDAEPQVRLHSNITEDIDRLALLYVKAIEYADRLNRIFALPLVATLVNCFLYALVSLYSLVHDVGKMVQFEKSDEDPPQALFNVLSLVFFAIDMYFLVWISDAVIAEANRTGRILLRTASFQIDRKTKECIEMFSLRILQSDKLLVACGLFVVDKTLVYGMVGALTSYLTILIQFDLAGQSAIRQTLNATASNATS